MKKYPKPKMRGGSIMVYEVNTISEDNGGVKDTRLEYIGKKVSTRHGEGYIKAIEIFPDNHTNLHRFLVKITNNNKQPILKTLFPKNELCYHKFELNFI